MSDRRFDSARDSAEASNRSGLRWFFVYTSWTDVVPPGGTIPTDQWCVGRSTWFNEARTEWLPTSSLFETLWDPTRLSKPAVGSLVRAHWNPENKHWEIFNRPTVPQLQYTVDKAVEGWNPSGTPVLDSSYSTGWTGSNAVCGSPEVVGIRHLPAELAPSTNGNYECLTAGYYRLVLNGAVKVDYTAPSSYTTTVRSDVMHQLPGVYTGDVLLNTHRHDVEIPDMSVWDPADGPRLTITLYTKRVGAAIGIHKDHDITIGSAWPYAWTGQFHNLALGAMQIASEWHVNFAAGDKFSLRWTLTNHHGRSKIERPGGDEVLRFMIERLGDNQSWSLIT